MAVLATLIAAALGVLAACGQRGALYIPGKPGDPYLDRQHRGAVPGPGTAPGTAPNSTVPGNPSGLPPDTRPKLRDRSEDDTNS